MEYKLPDFLKNKLINQYGEDIYKKILKDIAMGEEDIYSGYDIVASSGKMDNNFQFITKNKL